MAVDSLSDAIVQPCQITVNGKDYVLTPLSAFDLANAEAYLRNQRLDMFLHQTRMMSGVNLPDAIRAKALADIVSAPVTLDDVLRSFTGKLYLIYLSLRKTETMLTYQQFEKLSIDNLTVHTIEPILLRITGLVTEDEDGEVPLETNNSMSTEEKSEVT